MTPPGRGSGPHNDNEARELHRLAKAIVRRCGVHHAEEANDLAQATLLALYEALGAGQIRSPQAIVSWIQIVARHKAFWHGRRRRREANTFVTLDDDEHDAIGSDGMGLVEARSELAAVYRTWTGDERELLISWANGDGPRIDVMRKRIFATRQRLRKKIRRRG